MTHTQPPPDRRSFSNTLITKTYSTLVWPAALFCVWVAIALTAVSTTIGQSIHDPSAPVDASTFGRIQQLRDSIALTNQDLAAMGATETQAEQVLRQLKSWYDTNQEALADNRRSQRQAQRDLRRAMQSILVGPRDAAVTNQMDSLRAAVHAARSQRQALLDALIGQLAGALTADQGEVWQTARSNLAAKVPQRFRFVPNLTTTQIDQLKAAAGNRSTEQSEMILQLSQKQHADQARQRGKASYSAVISAQATVLPMPTDLHEMIVDRDEEGL